MYKFTVSYSDLLLVKAWIRRHWDRMQAMDPFIGVLEATTAVTPMKAKEWYRHSGYKIN